MTARRSPSTTLTAPTGWAVAQLRRASDGEACHCGGALAACAGCGSGRCLRCDPYTSDDCRWSI